MTPEEVIGSGPGAHEGSTYFVDTNIGVSGTTRLAIRKTNEGFEARIGIAIMGFTNMEEEDFRACNYDPFHAEFHDNYAKGKGATEEEAVEALKKDVAGICNSLWAE